MPNIQKLNLILRTNLISQYYNMKKLLFFYLFLFTITVFAQKPQQFISGVAPEKVGMSSERLNRIEQLLNRKIAEKRIPGAVVLAARHGQLVLHKAYGMNDIEILKQKEVDAFYNYSVQGTELSMKLYNLAYEKLKTYSQENKLPIHPNRLIIEPQIINKSKFSEKIELPDDIDVPSEIDAILEGEVIE